MKRIEISVYLLPEELDIVRELAVDQGLSISALCRNLLLRSAAGGERADTGRGGANDVSLRGRPLLAGGAARENNNRSIRR